MVAQTCNGHWAKLETNRDLLDDLKECMRMRFVPPPYRKEHLLKFQRLHHGHRMVDAYFKDFETTLTKMNMHDNEESWFVKRN